MSNDDKRRPLDEPPPEAETANGGRGRRADDDTAKAISRAIAAAKPEPHPLGPLNDHVRMAGLALQRAVRVWEAENGDGAVDHVNVLALIEQALERLEWVDRYTCSYAHSYPNPNTFRRRTNKRGGEVTIRQTATLPIQRAKRWSWKLWKRRNEKPARHDGPGDAQGPESPSGSDNGSPRG